MSALTLRLFREFVAFGQARAALVLLSLVVLGLTEGAGLLMLIELLDVVGVGMGAAAPGGLRAAVAGVFGTLGLPMSLPALLVAFVSVVGLRGAIEARQVTASQWLQQAFVAHVRRRLYAAISHASWEFHVGSRHADFIHVLTHEADRMGLAAGYLLQMLVSATLALVYFAFAVWTSPAVAVLVGVAGSGLLWMMRRTSASARASGQAATAATEGLYRVISEHLAGMKIAKGYAAEDRHIQDFSRTAGEVEGAFVRAARVYAWMRQRLEFGSLVVLAVLVYVAREFLAVPVGEMLLLMFLFARFVPRLTGILSQAATVTGALPSCEAVLDLERRCTAAADVPSGAEAPAPPSFQSVRFDRVSFTYRGRPGEPAVSDLSLDIQAGATIALVGASGAGKSTVADLLLGLVAPSAGCITVDRQPLDPSRARAWRSRIGYVTQDTFLFHDTIRANLAWAAPGASEGDMWRALERAAGDDLVRGLPRGLDEVVGDRGGRLSGGERQRLALARALLRNPLLLVLDEATSALDAENEAKILAAIETLHGRMTIVIITHRLSAVRRADVIHVLERGRLIESATWDQLHRPGTRFFALAALDGGDRVRADRAAGPA